jgi:hypothetical protein
MYPIGTELFDGLSARIVRVVGHTAGHFLYSTIPHDCNVCVHVAGNPDGQKESLDPATGDILVDGDYLPEKFYQYVNSSSGPVPVSSFKAIHVARHFDILTDGWDQWIECRYDSGDPSVGIGDNSYYRSTWGDDVQYYVSEGEDDGPTLPGLGACYNYIEGKVCPVMEEPDGPIY